MSANKGRMSESAYKRAVAWRDAALADGWTSKPTYGEHEAEERASTLTREGFLATIITRTPDPKGLQPWNSHPKHEGGVNVWGPDKLAIGPGQFYFWKYLLEGLRKCAMCKSLDVDTERVGFAGRVCASCLPVAKKKHEYPGWTN